MTNGLTHTTNVTTATANAEGITIVRIFDAPRELVFDAWTQPLQFAQWFGEYDSYIDTETAHMDLRPGGAWGITMFHGPQKMEIPFGGEFVEVDRPNRLVMTLADPSGETSNAEILTVMLTDLGGKTEMHFTQTGGNLPAAEYERAMQGELIFFQRLAEHLERSA